MFRLNAEKSKHGFAVVLIGLLFALPITAQRIAIVAPDGTAESTRFAEWLSEAFEGKLRAVDTGAAEAAFRSVKVDNPFNIDAENARRIGIVIGSDFYLLVRSATQRRSSFSRPSYHEAYGAIYLINSRTGRMEHWHLESREGNTPAEAEALLKGATNGIADMLTAKIQNSNVIADDTPPFEIFDPDSKTMRPAMPYKRIKPEYTTTAYLYNIAATVDAEVSIDANGDIKKIDILRWAGYGLEESVIAAIRQMNWRPGERSGKALPMRILLRYNFTKIEKE